jgi:hypothetical protein
MKKNSVYKFLVIGIIFLFIGLGVQPVIATCQPKGKDIDYINITSEFTGLRKKHTVKMTQQELEELDTFLDSIYVNLINSQSDKEASKIINEAIMLLDRYDLLCGLSVEQVKRRFSQYNTLGTDSDYLPAKKSSNCLIIGRVTRTYFYSPLYGIIGLLPGSYPYNPFGMLIFLSYTMFKQIAMQYGFPFFPLRLGAYITMGSFHDTGFEWNFIPAKGWIITIGTNGTKGWIGEFIGTLGSIAGWWSKYYVGVEGFFGLKILNPLNDKTTLLGYTKNVGIEYD